MSQLEVDKVIPQSGTTLTLGESGDTVSVPSGATLDASNATLTLPDGSVTTAKIADSNITTAKLADANITTAKLAYNPNPFRNIIINGDMSIAQRSTSVASITASGYYTLDRWQTAYTSLGTWTQSQSTDVPSGQGFATSLKMDCTTADAAPSANDILFIAQKFEGQNLQYLKKGTANAESLTLSFWVKSNKTGTYIVDILDSDNNRNIANSYTINSANTWEKKTITFAGDTTGTLDNDNSNSLQIEFYLGAGSSFTSGSLPTSWETRTNADRAVGQVNLADDTANEWYITGVQLEAGTTASDFEFLPVDVNLARCQRYFIQYGDNAITKQITTFGSAVSVSEVDAIILFPYEMRAVPTISSTNIRASDNGGGNFAMSSVTIASASTTKTALIYGTVTGATQYRPYAITTSTSAGYIHLSSEL